MSDEQCGRIMVGSGTDTYDPVCDEIAARDRIRSRLEGL